MSYRLKSGQINFESTDKPGSYACIVIKNGEFFNMTEELKKMLIEKIQATGRNNETTLEDMF